MDKQSEIFLEYLKKEYAKVKSEIQNKTMTYVHVQAWINHLPKGDASNKLSGDWDDEIYKLSNKFLQELKEYSVKQKFFGNLELPT